jgi:type VI secretion system protein ImpK
MESGAESMKMPAGVRDILLQELKQGNVGQQPDPATDTPRLHLLVAAQLARLGRYDEAEGILARLDGYSELQAECMDLRARMLAQQGRYVEAEACWLQALKLSPDNQAFQRGLAAIAEERRYPFWLRIAVAVAAAAATSITGVAVLIAMLKWTGWFGR